MSERGRFIVVEGGEGCGKSTQAKRLASTLGAVLTREPGGTDIGLALRALLLDPETRDLDDRAEMLLMAADRAQHVATVIEPALAAGRDVVCDRFVGSSVAYQGYGRGIPTEDVLAASRIATRGLEPDLVVLLVVSPEVSALRLGAELDRFESAGEGFHSRVLEGFGAQAEADQSRWAVVDGVGSRDEVARRIATVVAERLAVRG
ncbi:MAG: dTMP kinase [Microthrixaceae bacterium]|nr:dTMP kinase [Microthrixaceae bacterium]